MEKNQHSYTPTYISKMKYHKSWNWLMPVYSKCYDIACNNEGSFIMMNDVKDALLQADINDFYKEIVNFIKEYNNE